MKRFKSPGRAQRFLAIHGQVANLFRTPTTAPPITDKRNDRLTRSGPTSRRLPSLDVPTKSALFHLNVAS